MKLKKCNISSSAAQLDVVGFSLSGSEEMLGMNSVNVS